MTTGRSPQEEHPVLVREVAGADGARRLALRVFCSRRAGSVPLETCEACTFCTDIGPGADGVSAIVRCQPPQEGAALPATGKVGTRLEIQMDLTPVGAILHGGALCIGTDAQVAVLLGLLAERELAELFVVDEDGRLVGMVRDVELARALRPNLGADPSPLKVRQSRVDAVMSTATPVDEFASVQFALRRMANGHLRAVPIVTREGQLVGVLRDIDCLRWIAAHRRGSR